MTDSFSIIGVLQHHGLPFTVIGGHAVIAHGVIRTTEDVDLVYHQTETNIDTLFVVLTSIGGFIITDEVDQETGLEKCRPVTRADCARPVLLCGTQMGYLDAFGFVPGLPDEDVKRFLSDSIVINGVSYASLDWLRRMKQAAGREQDLKDLEALGFGHD